MVKALKEERSSWGFEEGDEIVPGRHALRLLGGGTSYEAYLTWDDRLYALIVAKVLRPAFIDDEHSLKNLRSEAEMLERLAHPVIVRGFGSVLDGARPHVALEFLEGPHLSRLLRKQGPLQLEQFVPLALQLSSAVHYMRQENVVHLDIKPRNIIMGAPPRLIDLSVARSFERAARISGIVGTDSYMAPEQCAPSERGPVGPAADVWGLGATLFHAVTGTRPFPRPDDYSSDDSAERFPQLHREHEPWPKEVPPRVQEIIDGCLRPEPESRFSPADVADRLEEVMTLLPKKRILSKLKPRLR